MSEAAVRPLSESVVKNLNLRGQLGAYVKELIETPSARVVATRIVAGVEHVEMEGPFFTVEAKITGQRNGAAYALVFKLDDGQSSRVEGVESTRPLARQAVDLYVRLLIAQWAVVRQRVKLAHGSTRQELVLSASRNRPLTAAAARFMAGFRR